MTNNLPHVDAFALATDAFALANECVIKASTTNSTAARELVDIAQDLAHDIAAYANLCRKANSLRERTELLERARTAMVTLHDLRTDCLAYAA